MQLIRPARLAICAMTTSCIAISPAFGAHRDNQSRSFQFTYQAAATGLPAGQTVRMWVPLASSNEYQTVAILSGASPGKIREDPKYHNHMLYLEQPPSPGGTLSVEVQFQVTRYMDDGKSPVPSNPTFSLTPSAYLQANARVPVGGKSLRLIAARDLPADPLQLAHTLYETVFDHMTYRKDRPGWGNGDSDWACDSGYGNCTDFHSLFISLARAEHIPAKFDIGFMIPPAAKGSVPGYHCWAEFKPAGHPWLPADISDASEHPEKRESNFGRIDDERVMFTTGRDITLSPPQAGPPVNFFVYPYVEVAGKPWPQEKIEKHFTYRDVPSVPAQASAR